MPCRRRIDEAAQEEYIRKNRITIDPFEGVTDPVENIRIRHQPKKHDPLITYVPPATPSHQLYRDLTEPQLARLTDFVVDNLISDKKDVAINIARELAAFTEIDMTRVHQAFLQINRYGPGYIFRGASRDIARLLIDRLEDAVLDEDSGRDINDILSALAWAGTEDVLRLFALWHAQPPAWRSRLYIPPEQYARDAGWELDTGRATRSLILGKCYPLLKSEGCSDIGPVSTCLPLAERCQWCGTALTGLLAFDLIDRRLDFIPFQGRKLTFATCHICAAFTGQLYMKVGPDGEAAWYAGNERPEYLPEDSASWESLPVSELRLSPKTRLLHHAVDWCLPVQCSQIGGIPTWIDDEHYGHCPECSKGLVFVGQLAAEDVDSEEGIYYALMCADCSITVVRFQQS
jgi:hypothetical protein